RYRRTGQSRATSADLERDSPGGEAFGGRRTLDCRAGRSGRVPRSRSCRGGRTGGARPGSRHRNGCGARNPGVRRGATVGRNAIFTVMTDLGMNERAWALTDECVAHSADWRIAWYSLPGGARVIDAGVNVAGGFAAGRTLARICMGGL